jgi:uncharacterized protein (DUF1800 family)
MRTSRRSIVITLLLTSALVSTVAVAKKKPAPAAMNERERAIHALNRLTFGPRPGDVERVMSVGVDNWIDEQLHPEKIDDSALQARLAPYGTLKMSTRELVEHFPPPQMIKAVADGRMSMPSDPKLRAVYESQIEGYRLREQKTSAGKANDGDDHAMMNDNERRESRELARMKAASLENLPASERFDAVLRMAPEERRMAVQSMLEAERYKLLADMTPGQRETLMALRSPQQAVASELQEAKLVRAIYSERQLEEVMTDFWFNHFNVFLGKGADRYLVTSYERDVIRPHALGKFKDLLRATADSPAMLFYLDNWLSVGPDSPVAHGIPPWGGNGPFARRAQMRRKQNPNAKKLRNGLNENYARELMELHTLGVNGGYTQKDVTEVARVFTGWTLNEPRRGGSYQFNERMHEPGTKIVLGHKIKEHGEDEGKQVLDILAHRPSTAHFISTKLAMRFVSDNPPPALVDRMAKTFLEKDGDIREVLKTMFASPEFWSADTERAKVKTPLEFVASAVRASVADVTDPLPLVRILNRMGMPLYGAQPPTGYSMKAETWVNSAALLDRLNFALGLAAGKLPGVKVDSGRAPQSAAAGGSASVEAVSAPADPEKELLRLENSLLEGKVSAQTHDTIRKELNELGPAKNVNLVLAEGLLLGSPEFQRR